MIAWIVLGYLAIGFIVALVGPAAESIDEEHQKARSEFPSKAQALRLLLVLGMMALWPVLFPSAVISRRREKHRNASNLFVLLGELSKDGTNEDVIPGAVGEFGLTPTNPVPTHTPLGSVAYLRSLRTTSGGGLTWSRRGSTTAEGVNKPIDVYDVSDTDGRPLATFFISPYQKRNSRRAPRGFQIGTAAPAPNAAIELPTKASPAPSPRPPETVASMASAETTQPKGSPESLTPPASGVAREYLVRALKILANHLASHDERATAETCLRMAADLGMDTAPFYLGAAYWSGAFGTQDADDAHKWRDRLRARKWAEIGAAKGDSAAAALLRTIEKDWLTEPQTPEPDLSPPTINTGVKAPWRRSGTATEEASTKPAPPPPRRRTTLVTGRPANRLIPEDRLDFLLFAMGARAGLQCREDARDGPVSSLDPSLSLDEMAFRIATRRELLNSGSVAGTKGRLDGADPMFDERRAIFIAGVEQGLVGDDDE